MDEHRGDRASYWYGHLDRAAASGLSLRAYAEQAGVKLHRLYFWGSRRRAANEEHGAAGLFARVEVAKGVRYPGPGIQRLHLPGGAILEWEGAADFSLIERLLDR